jgi:hypothetical protein
MTSRRRFLAICFGFWGHGFGALQARLLRETARGTDNVWVERRYKVEAVSFKALDESGIDFWGKLAIAPAQTAQLSHPRPIRTGDEGMAGPGS